VTAVPADEASVLHTLRIRGFVGSQGFIASLGEDPVEILDFLVSAGHVRRIEPDGLYRLLPSGESRHRVLLEDYADERVRSTLSERYGRFRPANDEVKELCGAWQVRGTTLNDHADARYDEECINRLIRVYAAARPVLEGFAHAVPRMARYIERLDDATGAVVDGRFDRFTGVMCESVHDIWMELHEDLLILLGIDRVEEGSF
jgi:hypothetical protein